MRPTVLSISLIVIAISMAALFVFSLFTPKQKSNNSTKRQQVQHEKAEITCMNASIIDSTFLFVTA